MDGCGGCGGQGPQSPASIKSAAAMSVMVQFLGQWAWDFIHLRRGSLVAVCEAFFMALPCSKQLKPACPRPLPSGLHSYLCCIGTAHLL